VGGLEALHVVERSDESKRRQRADTGYSHQPVQVSSASTQLFGSASAAAICSFSTSMKHGSQNAIFVRDGSGDARDHPRGQALATRIGTHLRSVGIQSTDPDNWRDSGWGLKCVSGAVEFQVILAGAVDSDRWFLQVAPTSKPGFLTRAFSRADFSSAALCFSLAAILQTALAELGATDQHWRWDGPPTEQHPRSPQPPGASAS
jgi:hypothetical protein